MANDYRPTTDSISTLKTILSHGINGRMSAAVQAVETEPWQPISARGKKKKKRVRCRSRRRDASEARAEEELPQVLWEEEGGDCGGRGRSGVAGDCAQEITGFSRVAGCLKEEGAFERISIRNLYTNTHKNEACLYTYAYKCPLMTHSYTPAAHQLASLRSHFRFGNPR